MRKLLLGMSAVLCLLGSFAAQANDGWRSDRWEMRELRRACDWGDRRACIRLGREIEQRREARRGRWERWEAARDHHQHWRDLRLERRW